MMHLGEFHRGHTVHLKWTTNDLGGQAITRATNGTISVYSTNNTTQTTTGVTDTEDFDSVTGLHHVAIALTDAFYVKGGQFQVVLTGAVVDGVTIAPVVLAHFSISYADLGTVVDDAANSATTFETDLASAVNDFHNEAFLTFISGSLAGQTRRISDYDGSTKFVTLDPAATAEPTAGDTFLVVAGV